MCRGVRPGLGLLSTDRTTTVAVFACLSEGCHDCACSVPTPCPRSGRCRRAPCLSGLSASSSDSPQARPVEAATAVAPSQGDHDCNRRCRTRRSADALRRCQQGRARQRRIQWPTGIRCFSARLAPDPRGWLHSHHQRTPPITLDRTANVDGDADIYYFFAVTYSNKAAEGSNPFNLSIQVTSGTSKAAAIFDSESGRDLATTMSCPE